MPKWFSLLCAIPLLLGTGARAQPPEEGRTLWDHNGSIMYLVANESSREFYYQKPRPGMLEAGAHPDALLFKGQINDGQISGVDISSTLNAVRFRFMSKEPLSITVAKLC